MTEPSTKKVVLTLRIDEDLHTKLSVKLAQERVPSFQQLAYDMVSEWVQGKRQTPQRQPQDLGSIPEHLQPYVQNFALWLMEEPLSEKERLLKESFMRIFEPKQQKGKKRA